MAFTFNGSSQRLRIDNSIISSWPFTMSCHYNPSLLDDFRVALAICPSTDNNPYFYLGSRNTAKATGGFTDGVTGIAVNSSTSLSLSEYAVITAKFESTQVTLYVNGTNEGSSTHNGSFYAGTNRFSIGNNDRLLPSAYTSGSIAEPAIWNVALSDAEIASLAKNFTPDQIRPQSLQFYAPLMRNLVDLRGGRTITNVNSATVATHPRIIT